MTQTTETAGDRWNGWGDTAIETPLSQSAFNYLQDSLGNLEPGPSAPFETLLEAVPASRLPEHPLVRADPADRARHARGQSLPDWVSLRFGRVSSYPDGVAYPEDPTQVAELIVFAKQSGAVLIPHGGGTSVVGHINPPLGDRPALTLDLRGMVGMKSFDPVNRLATIEAGATGPAIERHLAAHGFTLGHFPQSFERSTLGGWIATRSSGQQSIFYGRIEQLVAGARVETSQGGLELPSFPASAAGPDLRHILLGSEGRLGVITRATLRVRPSARVESFHGYFFPNWEAGIEAVREMVQSGLPVSMLRLSDPTETATSLIFSSNDRLIAWADRGLTLLGQGSDRCLLIAAFTGDPRPVASARRQAGRIVRSHGGLHAGQRVGNQWKANRFRSAYLRNSLWEAGVAVDTLETVLPWSQIIPAGDALRKAIQNAAEGFGERALILTHSSHAYQDGASLYVTVLFRIKSDPDECLAVWERFKGAASQVIIAHGGTISHQHGIGRDHTPYIEEEKGPLGVDMLQAIFASLDPEGIFNPGALFEENRLSKTPPEGT